jgi:uncharacterized protein (DUF2236 family)
LKTFRESKEPVSKKLQVASSSSSALPEAKDYGPYFLPVEEPDEMKKIVAESASMELGVAAVLLQIAYPMVRPYLLERNWIY